MRIVHERLDNTDGDAFKKAITISAAKTMVQ